MPRSKHLAFLLGIFAWHFCHIHNIFTLIFLAYRLVIALVYYAVSFSSGTYGGNRYLVFFLTSLMKFLQTGLALYFAVGE